MCLLINLDEDSNAKSYAAENVCIMYGSNIKSEIGRRTNKKVATINDANILGAIINVNEM